MKKIGVVAIILSVLVVSAILSLKPTKVEDKSSTDNNMTETVSGGPTMKPVTKDDSFTSIESDLDSTILVNEDFSDL